MADSHEPTRRFQRRVEDFTCERCGAFNVGDGYTNHCSVCLTSKHVDIHPGDRTAACGGLMRPVSVDASHGRWRLTHRCERCSFERANFARDEETGAVIRLMRELADERTS
ncbi:MAG: RNHCP domain-containing protein [Gammaproteobacteria bacterium]|nr:RNHCP domain-containing protein [Gammaproteobacteria bacterium]